MRQSGNKALIAAGTGLGQAISTTTASTFVRSLPKAAMAILRRGTNWKSNCSAI